MLKFFSIPMEVNMKKLTALCLALLMIFYAAMAAAEAFTPITVEGDNYLNNLDTCIASIDQIVLETNETFSFNETVGARSEEQGYCAAANGRGVEVIGGGVAQVATTIYLAIKNRSDMEVVEKSTYGSDFCEKYVPSEQDAVLADYNQAVDFRFTNLGGTVTIDLWRDESMVYCSISEADQ